MEFFVLTFGWMLALVLALGWWLSTKYDAHERELVGFVNQLQARVAQLESQLVKRE